jgi:hypothetical protein
MSIEMSNQWERAKAAAWHALRCTACVKKAQRVLVLDSPPMRELLLREIERCQQNTRVAVL